MVATHSTAIPVIDFRRQSMVLDWHALSGTWTPCDEPPALLHGVALIRASQPNMCIYGRDGLLHLQVGSDQYALSENSPRLRFIRDLVTLGLRRYFLVESSNGGTLLSHAYWSGQGDDFFRWLTSRANDPEWRSANGRLWSDGAQAAVLRSR